MGAGNYTAGASVAVGGGALRAAITAVTAAPASHAAPAFFRVCRVFCQRGMKGETGAGLTCGQQWVHKSCTVSAPSGRLKIRKHRSRRRLYVRMALYLGPGIRSGHETTKEPMIPPSPLFRQVRGSFFLPQDVVMLSYIRLRGPSAGGVSVFYDLELRA